MQPLPVPELLSVYILTWNADQYLDTLLSLLKSVADEILIVDSGSTDQTIPIAERHGCRIIYRPMDNFRSQRNFALQACQHSMVMMVDADELPDAPMLVHLQRLKREGFTQDAYRFQRYWYVLGQRVTCVFPVVSPDTVVRLVRKGKVTFGTQSGTVHERPSGYASSGLVDGALHHHTFGSDAEIGRKLEQYTAMAANDIVTLGQSSSRFTRLWLPTAVWLKWYGAKGGWRDGRLGWKLGRYAYQYAAKRLAKAHAIRREQANAVGSSSVPLVRHPAGQ